MVLSCIESATSERVRKNIDPFAPVFTKDYGYPWAQKPMSASEVEIKFIKFLGDTLYSIKNGIINPLYKMDFRYKILSKESVSQMGPFNKYYYLYCLKDKLFTEVDKIYETSEYIVLIPGHDISEGYYWIDKRNNNGFHIASTFEYENEMKKVVTGKSIIMIAASAGNEIISCFDSS